MDCLDFFNRYMMGSVQMFVGFYFYTKFFKRKINPAYCLMLLVLGVAITEIFRVGNIAEFVLYVLLLSMGVSEFSCKAWECKIKCVS